ncbi:MAG: hypothetical protein ABSF69_22645 [Polyangiaceae bacterium]
MSAHPHHLRAGLHRLFALTGIAPLGAFLVIHTALNASALWGTGTLRETADQLRRIPGLRMIEALFVFAPLVAHGGMGLWLILTSTSLAMPRPYSRTMRVAVRASGVAAVAFIGMHLWEVRFHGPGAPLGGDVITTVLAADLSATSHGVPWRGAVYLVGTACVAFHFASGLWGRLAVRSDGVTTGRRLTAIAAGSVGAVLWLTLLLVVLFHATGVRPFGGSADEDGNAAESCPVPSR